MKSLTPTDITKSINKIATLITSLSLSWALPGWSICPEDLPTALAQPWVEPFAQIGIAIAPEDAPDRPIVAINTDKSFIPASTIKLLTTAAALLTLGENFRITTRFHFSSQYTLTVEGGGDPGFSTDRDLPQLIRQLQAQGIRQVRNLAIKHDDRWGAAYGTGWEWQDLQEPYAAPVSIAPIDQNILLWQTKAGSAIGEPVQFRWAKPSVWQITNLSKTAMSGTVDSLKIAIKDRQIQITGSLPIDQNMPIIGATPVPDPEQYFLQLLRQALEKQGIKVSGSQLPRDLSQAITVEILSAPLAELVRYTNQESNNFYAEQLLRILGKTHPNTADYEISGIAIINTLVDTPGLTIADGSGLSRHNQASPSQLITLLSKMRQHPKFRQSLAIAGIKGTLTDRLLGLRLQGKTGTLQGVATISGYLQPPNYQPLVFAIMINHSQQSTRALRHTIDQILQIVNQLQHC